MPAHVVQGIGYITAVIAAGFAIYYWRRSASLYSLLVEGANRFEEIRQRNQLLEKTLGKAEQQFSQHKEHIARLERGIDEARNRTAEAIKRLEANDHDLRVQSEKFDLQRNYFEKQMKVLEEQSKASEASKKQIEAALEKSTKELQLQAAAASEGLQLRIKDLELRLQEKDAQLTAAKSKQVDSEELRKIKRRIAQYERLYGSMRGLKEMTEERNRNWEVALKKLSHHILSEIGHNEQDIPKNIGPLVAEALHAIGAQLIDDNEFIAGATGPAGEFASDSFETPLNDEVDNQDPADVALKDLEAATADQ